MTPTALLMRVVIRTDASLQIGTGHVMRCLTLATELVERGAQVQFICQTHDGHLIDLIKGYGFAVISLPKDTTFRAIEPKNMPEHGHWLGCDWQTDVDLCRAAIKDRVDWIIVDHYSLDHRWETAMRDQCHQMMCIDDLADRKHNCDLLLDQSLGRCEDDYSGLVPEQALLLLGPKYALLRPEFAQWRAASLARRKTPKLRHILITMGGVDAKNVTGRVLNIFQGIGIATLEQITVVLGPNAPWRDRVLAQAKNMSVPTLVLSGVDNIAELMTSSDLAIGAGGTTNWERCVLGVPSILVVLAENQRNIADCMNKSSAAFVIEADQQFEDAVLDALQTCQDPRDLKNCGLACATICDGAGVERVVLKMASSMEGSYTVRNMARADIELVLGWRNDPSVRKYMFNADTIDPEINAAWFNKTSRDPHKRLLLVCQYGKPF